MNIAAGLKATAKSLTTAPKAESFRAGGKPIECPHCENILFHKKKASLNFAMSWAKRQATVLVCANCSRLEWFYDDVEEEKA